MIYNSILVARKCDALLKFNKIVILEPIVSIGF